MIPLAAFAAATRFDQVFSLPAKAEREYAAGRLLAVDLADGRAARAADTAGLMVVGRCEVYVDNTEGNNDDVMVRYITGTFSYNNSTAHPIPQSHYGKPVFVENDTTVGTDPGTNNIFAGFFRGFERGKVWIDTRPLPMLAVFFGNNPNNNWRLSADAETGASVLQLWNQTQEAYQTVQLDGADGLERLIIA